MPKSDAILLRKARLKDSELVRLWRNDPQTRRNSFDKRAISGKRHAIWFKKILRDPYSQLYLALYNQNPAGVIRFDFLGKVIRVNINVNPALRGRGIGRAMLIKASGLIRRRYPGCIQKALIKRHNSASEKIFADADFIKIHEIERPACSLWIRP